MNLRKGCETMKDFLEKFTEYCKTPGVEDSNKAKSYSKAIEYLCAFLKITKIDAQAVEKIKSIEGYISDKNSAFYKELLGFLTERKQKSYLDNGFIRAVLKPFFEFASKNAPDMKEKFRKWFSEQPQRNNPLAKYKDETIDAAIRLIERGMAKLGISKYVDFNCFTVTNYSEFKSIHDECYAYAEKFDKGQNHSDFRNGLDYYLLFLKELSDSKYSEKIKKIIESYKADFEVRDKEERYKWIAVGTYKRLWDIDANNFADMLKSAFNDTANLLRSGNYYPYKMLGIFAEKEPEAARSLFKMLYDESISFEERCSRFKDAFDKYFKPQGLNHYQDLHAISVYLTCEYPEKYYIYKYSIVKEFIKQLQYECDSIDKMTDPEKLELMSEIYDIVLNAVKVDNELQKMSQSRLDNTCYQDEAFHMLTHDIIYFASKYEVESKIGIFDSWEIVDEVTAFKTCDKSFFDYNGSGVPKGICWFFDAEELEAGKNKPIKLVYEGKEYSGKLTNDTTDRRRIQIRWNSDLGVNFDSYKNSQVKAKFVKVDVDTYQITMNCEDANKNAWLLAWNPNSWDWEDLEEACEITKRGESYSQTWSCASSSVKIGDTVYLTTLGTDNNGIVASGRAVSEQYEYEHWDEQKRAEGKKNKGIDIELDYILNPYEKTPLRQAYLKKNYPEQHWSPQASGISIQEKYVEKLHNDWMNYISKIQGGEKEMTIKEKINAIKNYIAAKGFNYEGDLIENFYLSLKSKPFVILAGTSGTGKTRLVKLFAEAIGAKMKLVPVRPDWSDSSDLFGHTDLSGNFQPGTIIDFIKQAEWDSNTPHFICLDEMNLARVEYYLSDFLSVIETRDRKANGEIETDPLVDVDYYKDENAKVKYGRVFIPENLYIVGTVNMDETTFPFSKKVLDRANTIEFSYVNLMSKVNNKEEIAVQKLDNSFLKTEYLYLRDCDDNELIENICFDLEELNQILVKANLHVGYRVRDEISFYLMNNKKSDLLSKDAAFDNEIMQKILPRVQGSSAAIKDVLSELFIKCAGDYTGFSGISAYEQMESYIESKECKYPNSAKKIKFMMRRYEEDGFTSYWL